ncbi:30S ribosomal protein S3 [Candidatus Woesearchaeota archaeon]|nr:30S ribosomal protein S3 [Candidatus Woesearchaeota archaeon]
MIERKFVEERLKEFQIQEYISRNLKGIGHSRTKLVRTPLGEKIVIYAARPGLVVGRQGQNIKNLTIALKKKFNLENPQIEISEVERIDLDAHIVAERIANALERFGSQKFKAIGHKAMTDVMNAGALGVEIIIAGKLPSSRAKSWRFYHGYLKKSGEVSFTGVHRSHASAQLKAGTVGIKVSIMPPGISLPDTITVKKAGESAAPVQASAGQAEAAEQKGKEQQEKKEGKKEEKKRKPRRKRKAEEAHEEKGG